MDVEELQLLSLSILQCSITPLLQKSPLPYAEPLNIR